MPTKPHTTWLRMVPLGTAMALSVLPLALRPLPMGDAARSMPMAGPLWFWMATLFSTGDAPSMTTPLP